jgi:glycogen(starch) synthase
MSTDAVGGVWTYSCELRDALREEGVEVVLATLGPKPPPERDVAFRRCRLEWQEDPWEDVASSGRWLTAVAEEIEAQAVHLNGFAHGALDWRAPTVTVAHSCLLSWHRAVRGGTPPSAWEAYGAAVQAGLQAADALVAPTRAMLGEIQQIYGAARDGTVIHNGVAPGPAPRRRRDPFVLGAGRLWDEAKGLRTLARAGESLSWPVELAGDAAGARPRGVRLLGALGREALRARMARASVFAHPASYEPFGLAVLEAASAGCALVLGDIASLRELWDGAAAFVSPGDPAALAAALQRLIEDERERARLAALAEMRARDYTIAASARSYASLYARLAQRTALAR